MGSSATLLCGDPRNFSREDLVMIRDMAIREYHQIPISDGYNRKRPEDLQAEAWGKAVVGYLVHNGWDLVRKEKR